ncbi:MAG: hypothetical protein Q8N23_28200 [Archangium sp.]|nr:hypothetical protein [Archangium sp.]MDP3156587.1 hypothetical protein [Archangium sp.]MDP3576312.1 hypothetical protein [Archangium sp.]
MKTLLIAALLLFTGCSASKKVAEPAQVTLKPGAPTSLESEVSSPTAQLRLRFSGPGENVAVVISGIDGVTVTTPPEAISGAAVKSGEVRALRVDFTGRGHLVVSVQGTFNGAKQSRVHTVAIGEVVLENDGKTQLTTDGDAVKLIP